MPARHINTIARPANRVVIVGAGLSGLSAALHLRGTGADVTIVERASAPGGRVGAYEGPGGSYRIDSGATVLTMPGLIDEALAAVGSDRARTGLVIRQLAPAYHGRFADGTTIDVHSDPEAMEHEVRRACGAAEATRYRELRAWLGAMFDTEYDRFIAANFDSPLDLANSPSAFRDMARLIALGGFSRLGKQVAKRIEDPRLRRIFTFQALYAGMPPARALGVYGAIAHMDTSLGVYFPDGGMHRITEALAAALIEAGGSIHYNTEITGLEHSGSTITAATTAEGHRIPGDAFILTGDLPITDQLLARTPARIPRRATRWSPSAFILHGTIPQSVTGLWDAQAHHTIDFGDAWDSTFEQLTARRGKGTVMSDPSLLITRPTLTSPAMVADGATGPRELLSVLAPAPNLVSAPLAWDALEPSYQAELLGTLERRGYKGISEHFAVDHVDSPRTWAAQGMAAGTPFSAAHSFPQTGPFRRRNLVRGVDNVVLAGCGTTPGVGVPTTMISGRLAAQRITGAP